jgi:hypothetical protein
MLPQVSVATWIALGAVVLTFLGLVVNVVNSRVGKQTFDRGGWKLRARLDLAPPTDGDMSLRLRVHNAGMQEATITRFTITMDTGLVQFKGGEIQSAIVSGPALEFVLPSGKEVTWELNVAAMLGAIAQMKIQQVKLGMKPFRLVNPLAPFRATARVDIHLGSGDEFAGHLGLGKTIKLYSYIEKVRTAGSGAETMEESKDSQNDGGNPLTND